MLSALAGVASTGADVDGWFLIRKPSTMTVALLPGGRSPSGTATTGVGAGEGDGDAEGVTEAVADGVADSLEIATPLGAGDTSTASHGTLSSPLPTATPTDRMPIRTRAATSRRPA